MPSEHQTTHRMSNDIGTPGGLPSRLSLAYWRLLFLFRQVLECILVNFRAKPKLRSPIGFRLAWSERGTPSTSIVSPCFSQHHCRDRIDKQRLWNLEL
jgi:hypothetical protein